MKKMGQKVSKTHLLPHTLENPHHEKLSKTDVLDDGDS
jgi:hypothetical protein